ncbi:carbohydrate ABC transporter permease [Paenibacillus glucanolyticus]|jgi:putative aldouronate transport system permease protein|uniref:Sugar ABC transporter permease n=1 Tax=Paenibacillus glucanolyticus TaxID=59843 RepID=A0A163F658_9BACL|nr:MULTISPECIES: carbohydrate ABC transporter permease [Paenibacillus]ANA78779.1 sugar ABC transporter permease [Paenibacillus glucanolyticus]AVV57307.1 carbohydrate ABC transporter permease [Paenibacillus glucanolyticus]AWP26463.1 sugar ABC transporter permease [Paenibacillus sp. Cedars]ETT35477.1 binding-protein-dependent transport systems inner membrane component [Paenibacillus sp. FSL R5-808]KZS44183.1 sugar ABC transporter permease [Paenibacillus glucanolyticus]
MLGKGETVVEHEYTRKRVNGKELMFRITLAFLCAFIFLLVAYPLYFIVIASFSDSTLVSTGKVMFIPKNISFFGYQEIFKDMRIWTGYRNTLFYTVFGTLINMLFTLPAAYVLSRKEFRARRIIMLIFVITMFFNGGLIPTYLLMKGLGLTNTIWVFILPFSVNVFYLIIARTFFENSLPQELHEAAVMDGCSHFTFFFKVALPLSKALVSVIGLYYLVGHWNDFFTALIYIRDTKLQPLQIVLRDILLSNQVFSSGAGTGGDAGGYAQRYADQIKYGVIIVSTLPILLIYPFMQKYFEKGVMIGSIKG